MPTYIIRQKPSRPNTQEDERPAQEIAANIRAGNRATTAWGGWSIGTCWKKIRPGDRLLFYRSDVGGFFAVGHALRADDQGCRKLREDGLRKRFPNKPEVNRVKLVGVEQLAAFRAVSWETGEWREKKNDYYINAEWGVVVDPCEGKVIVPYQFPPGHKASGHAFPDKEADDICAKCARSGNALHS